MGEIEGDGGVEVAFEGEMAHNHIMSPGRVDVPPSLVSLDLQRHNVTTLLEALGQH